MDTAAKDRVRWYVLRDLKRANAKTHAYQMLENLGIEVFTPMTWKLMTRDGRREKVHIPVMPDLVFAHSSTSVLDPIISTTPTLQYRFIRGGYCLFMTVGDKDMEIFKKAIETDDSPKYYRPEEITAAMCGKSIKIEGGPLDGYEGRLLSVRGSKVKRIMVELPGLLVAAVEVQPEFIRIL